MQGYANILIGAAFVAYCFSDDGVIPTIAKPAKLMLYVFGGLFVVAEGIALLSGSAG